MNATVDRYIEAIVQVEGGYANDPNDSGGETNWGVTVAVARAFGYAGHMRDMTKAQACAIYKSRYWDPLRLDDIVLLDPLLTAELLDTGVNMGVDRAGAFLQRALNALNKQGTLYPDVTVDGRVGPMTVAALREYLQRRVGQDGVTVLLRALNSLQGAYYIELAERRQKDEDFVFGWLRNRVS
jgi:lysozyme family protein